MPAKNHLSQEQKERLLKTLKEHDNSYVREKILILLLMNDGKTYQEISDFLDIAYPTVAYWAVHGDPDNLESFLDGRREGNFRKVTKEYEDLLLEVIENEPTEYGYEFGRWTAARLATYLEKSTGIKLSGSQVRRVLERKKYVYLWAKYSLEDKQNPEKRKAFKEKLKEYLRITKETPERLQVWFWDESGFSLRVIRRKNWGKKGTRKKVAGQRRKGRVNIMGGLRYHDKKRINFVIKKGNADVFYEQIKSLNNFLIQEWIEQGNTIDNFYTGSAKIVIILDNASFHKRKDVLDKIEAEMPNIILEFLPEYSPDYNLIELVWHSAKEYIAHRLFESVSQLEELLIRLLNEGGLIIKWERKIKNKGNAVY
ncbi:IS630 family transposase [Aetokthonos hydrillicola Thurmond2011]|jgi:transposase|uniref:IS630 family transposase n=1 Tax=Aetokthonos hydrillicola Thurmond2011 TaxID=2712845 RepID=A0AAP5IBB5_9CYAN|nr:IS630 family transposase [Aetokthonos hydrillicola]MBO3464476.1 IS630 family transposase [Aetokthonos hydrillicola CCALA 1050]MDR9896578.1 IS630 family transposase [Aetokthonos hydrillicola Thurmond2011]MDR9898991.1 IS630 family transposase [Aetokthonos hydrillicola Thurmond2011]